LGWCLPKRGPWYINASQRRTLRTTRDTRAHAANKTLQHLRIGDNPLGVSAGIKLVAGLDRIDGPLPTIHLEGCGLVGEVYGGESEHDPNGVYCLDLSRPHDRVVSSFLPDHLLSVPLHCSLGVGCIQARNPNPNLASRPCSELPELHGWRPPPLD